MIGIGRQVQRWIDRKTECAGRTVGGPAWGTAAERDAAMVHDFGMTRAYLRRCRALFWATVPFKQRGLPGRLLSPAEVEGRSFKAGDGAEMVHEPGLDLFTAECIAGIRNDEGETRAYYAEHVEGGVDGGACDGGACA